MIFSKSSTASALKTLFVLRCVSIVGQALTVLIAYMAELFPIRLSPAFTVIGILVLFNIYTYLRSKYEQEASEIEIFTQLLVDISTFTALLMLSGGPSNPFVSMYLLPLAIAASLLSAVWVWSLIAISVAAYSGLMWLEPQAHVHADHQNFGMHVMGMWVSFILSAAIIGYFILSIKDALHKKEQALADAREAAVVNEKLVALGTLAASTAHELGTPLGTIQLILSDIEDGAISTEEKNILVEQVQRCKKALSIMSASAGAVPIEGGSMKPVNSYLSELIADWQSMRKNIVVDASISDTPAAPRLLADKALSQALINILDNAADACPEAVGIAAEWDQAQVEIKVSNRKGTLSADALRNLGKQPYSEKSDGLGLGAFLSHQIITRMGGEVRLRNAAEGGVLTTIVLPLQQLS